MNTSSQKIQEKPRMATGGYVLITPAHNEAAFIERTLKSVVAQSVRPTKWVVVSDGSTDATDEIVKQYASQHPWIELLRMPPRKERHFAGKALAFNAGYQRIANLRFAYIGSLDADISFDETYFEFLLEKLEQNPRLGLVGTPFKEGDQMYDYRFVSTEHVSGACQLFRRECFEEVGGYTPLHGGGIDHVAVLTARMKGWQTRTFTDKCSLHSRAQGSAKRGPLASRLHVGALDYALGGHPVWEICRALYQMTKPPFIIGGLIILFGYASSAAKGAERSVSPEIIAFRHAEQMRRLRQFALKAAKGAWNRISPF